MTLIPALLTVQCTYSPMPTEFRVVDQTEDHYIFKKEDGTLGVTEKSAVRVVVISGYIR